MLDRDHQFGHGRDLKHLDLIGKRQSHVVSFHFLLNESRGPELVHFIFKAVKDFLFLGNRTRTFVDIEGDKNRSHLEMDIEKDRAGQHRDNN